MTRGDENLVQYAAETKDEELKKLYQMSGK